MSDTWSSLSDALASFPRLDGARCKGHWDVFDVTDHPEIVEYALHQCADCPALTACRDWFDSLRPSQRPRGVVAGRLNRGPQAAREAA